MVDIDAKMAGDWVKAYGRRSINFSSGMNIGKLPDFPASKIRVYPISLEPAP
jgi:hypothetical protein